jgi:hypothetical protein
MPNWVNNALLVDGPVEEVERFIAQAGAPYATKRTDFSDGDFKMVDHTEEQELSFWNFVRPDDSILEEYWGPERTNLPFEEAIQHKTNHWYDWNVRNWGTKWDACHLSGGDIATNADEACVSYDFDTAWSEPYPVFEAMVQQFPKLKFRLKYMEEQGWGGVYGGEDGEVFTIDSWDIPNSHADNIERMRYCSCEDDNYYYDDCPKQEASTAEQVH